MSLNYVSGYFPSAPERVLIHGADAQGKMYSGMGKALCMKWPEIMLGYSALCAQGVEDAGRSIMGRHTLATVDEGQHVVATLITQQFYGKEAGRRYLSYEALEDGLRRLFHMLSQTPYLQDGVAMPMIGTEWAGGDWRVVSAVLGKVAREASATVNIHVQSAYLQAAIDMDRSN